MPGSLVDRMMGWRIGRGKKEIDVVCCLTGLEKERIHSLAAKTKFKIDVRNRIDTVYRS